MKTNDKGITLVALVITIIILIILAGITLNTLLGDNGLISKAKQGASDYKKAAEDEESMLGNINAILDGTITTGGNNDSHSGGGNTPSEFVETDIGLTKAMSFSGATLTPNVNRIGHLEDLSRNKNFATLYSGTLTDDGKGLIFDGSNTYGEIYNNSSITFPLTIEATFSSTSIGNSIVYYDGITQTSISFYKGYLIATIGTDTYCPVLPADFSNGELKHVAITYNSLTDFNVYINGTLYELSSYDDSWGRTETMYLGGKPNGDYKFNGTLYTLRVYNKVLSLEEINNSYTSDFNMITNNSNSILRSNLCLEYVIKDNTDYTPTTITDQTNNGNNITNHNIYYDRFTKGFIFTGNEECYGEIDYQNSFDFPCTLEATFSLDNVENGIIYFDTISNVSLGLYDRYILTCIGTDVNTVLLPEELINNSILHIVVSYNTISDLKVYLNGVEQEPTTHEDAWGSGSGQSIGRRYSPGFNKYPFKGTLYELNIYNGAVNSTQVTTLYNNSVGKYPR